VKLVRANAFFAGGHKVHRLQPKAQLNMARFENGSDFHGERLAAVVALANAKASRFASHQPYARRIGIAAMRAYRAVRPNARFDISVSDAFIVEMGIRENRHG
jgi:hypothetical protein